MRLSARKLVLIGVLSSLAGKEEGKKSVICTVVEAGESDLYGLASHRLLGCEISSIQAAGIGSANGKLGQYSDVPVPPLCE
jgi:hypothetical protein